MSKTRPEGFGAVAWMIAGAAVGLIAIIALLSNAEAATGWADGKEVTDFSESVASGITGGDTSRWDTAAVGGTSTLADVMSRGASAPVTLDMNRFGVSNVLFFSAVEKDTVTSVPEIADDAYGAGIFGQFNDDDTPTVFSNMIFTGASGAMIRGRADQGSFIIGAYSHGAGIMGFADNGAIMQLGEEAFGSQIYGYVEGSDYAIIEDGVYGGAMFVNTGTNRISRGPAIIIGKNITSDAARSLAVGRGITISHNDSLVVGQGIDSQGQDGATLENAWIYNLALMGPNGTNLNLTAVWSLGTNFLGVSMEGAATTNLYEAGE